MLNLSKHRNYHPVSKRGYLMNIKTSHPFHCAYIDRDYYKQEIKREFDIKRHPYLAFSKRQPPYYGIRRYVQSKKWRLF